MAVKIVRISAYFYMLSYLDLCLKIAIVFFLQPLFSVTHNTAARVARRLTNGHYFTIDVCGVSYKRKV